MMLLISQLFVASGIAMGTAPLGSTEFLQLNLRTSAFFIDSNVQSDSTNGSVAERFEPPRRLWMDNTERYDIAYDDDIRLFLTAAHPEQGWAPSVEIGLLPALISQPTTLAHGVYWRDTGSYLSLRKTLPFGEIGATLFPRHTTQLRIGYTHLTSWFESPQGVDGPPGARLEWSLPNAYAFVAASTMPRQMDQPDGTKEIDTAWQAVAGAGTHLWGWLWADVEGTYARRGTIDRQELRVVEAGRNRTERWLGWGGAARLGIGQGEPLATPVNYQPLENDLFVTDSLVRAPATRTPRSSWALVATGTYLGQTLQDAVKPNATTIQPALAASLSAKAHLDGWHGALTAGYRDLAFILFSVPSNPNFMAFPEGVRVNAETRLGASAAIDWPLAELLVTTVVDAGVVWPAHTVAGSGVGDITTNQDSQRTLVFNSESYVTALNPGDAVEPLFEARLALRAPLGPWLMLVLELEDQYDRNQTYLTQGPDGIPIRVEARPNRVGINAVLRASL